MNLNDNFDVVVAGGGNAALCAAITAARAGRKVIVLEGAPEFYRGGNTRHTRNLRCAHDGTAPTMTGPYDPAEFLDDLYRVTGGQTDKALAQMTIERSARTHPLDEQAGRAVPAAARRHALARQDQCLLPRRRARHAERALPAGGRRSASRAFTIRRSPRSISKTAFSFPPPSSMKARKNKFAARRWSRPAAASRPISNG